MVHRFGKQVLPGCYIVKFQCMVDSSSSNGLHLDNTLNSLCLMIGPADVNAQANNIGMPLGFELKYANPVLGRGMRHNVNLQVGGGSKQSNRF